MVPELLSSHRIQLAGFLAGWNREPPLATPYCRDIPGPPASNSAADEKVVPAQPRAANQIDLTFPRLNP